MGNVLLSPIDRLVRLLADCPTWQGLIPDADPGPPPVPGDPFDYVHFPEAYDDDPYPRIVIDVPADYMLRQYGMDYYINANSLIMTVELEVADDAHSTDDFDWLASGSVKAEATWFYEKVGSLIYEMQTIGSTDGTNSASGETHLTTRSVRILGGPWRVPPEERNAEGAYSGIPPSLWWCVLEVRYD